MGKGLIVNWAGKFSGYRLAAGEVVWQFLGSETVLGTVWGRFFKGGQKI